MESLKLKNNKYWDASGVFDHQELKTQEEINANFKNEFNEVVDGISIGPVPIATFDANVADMPLKGLTANIGPVQSGSGDPSPDNVRRITGLTGCKLHRTGVSLIGGDSFIGNTFSKTASGYQLSYNGSSIGNRASGYADIRGLPAGRYTIEMLNPSYPQGVEVNIRRSTAGSNVTMGVIIASTAYGRRTYDIPENTTSLQLYIIPDTMPLNTSITMSDIVLVREADDDFSEPYKGNIYDIAFPSEAGTVYGGTLDALTGLLTVKWFGLCFDTAEKIEAMGSFTDNRMQIRTSDIPYPRIKNSLSQLCSHAKYQSNAGAIHQDTRTEAQFQIYPSDNRVFFEIPGVDSLQGYKDFATEQMNAGTPLTFVSLVDQSKYITYQLSPIEVATLLGENNIWANRGDVTVTYGAYLETLKASLDRTNSDLANLRACIAPTENGDTASQAYAQGAYFFRNGSFCVALLEISSGDQFTLGTNYKVVSVAEAILAMSFTILEQPVNSEAAVDTMASFTVNARGVQSYQWQYWTPSSTKWNDNTGDISHQPTFSIQATTSRYTYKYHCKLTSYDGTVIYTNEVKIVQPS